MGISKIKQGKRYRLRNGATTSPVRYSYNQTNYVFESNMIEKDGKDTGSILSWSKNGKYFSHCTESKYDIIEELN